MEGGEVTVGVNVTVGV
jgi:hypothetical protein